MEDKIIESDKDVKRKCKKNKPSFKIISINNNWKTKTIKNALNGLHENTKKYDELIIIICGHGKDRNMLVASDGSSLSIDKMRTTLSTCLKIFMEINIVVSSSTSS
ncbi:hypothetical protein RFI_29458 [Reticulomyxa filosa]|uniref:Caspase family p20 domain-containing protein n=1 Tax=Reticulomyxa filosa TaxID=46433 RepID=X6M390_RETFI|nr:hypothetical protein RFI_29458 [Reticulomyxa filosa]|eukprot:ETO07932.1 hypothetical protein RFI_29458 [Reticulomyxa filosa]